MKLLNFYSDSGIAMGLVEGDRVFNLTSASGNNPAFASVGAWLRSGDSSLSNIRAIRDRLKTSNAASVPFASLQHASMMERDARVFCVGLNYADHAAENNLPPPESPIFFPKFAAVVIPHLAEIPLPAISNQIDYEAEFVVVIGQTADRVSEEEAHACIAGYSIMNDVSARDMQRLDKQWFRAKNCNGFGPLGPWMVTADDVPDPLTLDIALRLNGETLQKSNTSNLVFSPAALISFLSQTLVLEPGDIISTGTPAGIGSMRRPQIFLKDGDRVEIEVSSIGVLENVVVSAKPK
jgi:2-keto-4-pentenoate hydratase/2-oxohepta-3-ene-1,7-dioic acid hydratase in catechol pathway